MNTHAVTYSPSWRILTSAFLVIGRLAPLVLFALLLFSPEPPANPLRLLRLFSILCLAPALVAWVLTRVFEVRLSVGGGSVVIEQRKRRIEIPCDAITAVDPWAVPLPGAGVWLRLPSGRRFQYGIQLDDPRSLIQAVADGGVAPNVRESADSPALAYARAKHAIGDWRWYHYLFRYVFFALVPALPLFRVHQWIAYGGTFGEYYQYGLKAYVSGFAVYWATLIVYLVLWAALWRAAAEIIAYCAASVAPSLAARVRRTVEVVHRVLYYGGVPVLLALRFVEW